MALPVSIFPLILTLLTSTSLNPEDEGVITVDYMDVCSLYMLFMIAAVMPLATVPFTVSIIHQQ